MPNIFNKITAYSLFSIFVFNACTGASTEKECAFGKPRPIFSKDIKGISNYSYTVNGNNATERLSLPELAYELEISEAGCEQKTQEIRLTLLPYQGQMEEIPNAATCAHTMGEALYNISQIAPEKLITLQQWGIAIAKQEKTIQYNTPISINNEPFTIQLDKMQQPESILITLIIKIQN